jgi:hypothetical protein
VRLIDISAGTVVKNIYDSKQETEALNARTGKAVIKKDQSGHKTIAATYFVNHVANRKFFRNSHFRSMLQYPPILFFQPECIPKAGGIGILLMNLQHAFAGSFNQFFRCFILAALDRRFNSQ